MNGKGIVRGSTWRRKKDGQLVRIENATNVGSEHTPYYDVRWRAVDNSRRSGACFEDYWLRDYEPVAAASSSAGGER